MENVCLGFPRFMGKVAIAKHSTSVSKKGRGKEIHLNRSACCCQIW